MNEIMLDLIDELTDPGEITLDEDIEDIIETEFDAVVGYGEDDDDIITMIANGGKLGYDNPIDFSDL